MKEIYIIVTKGCYACKVEETIIKQITKDLKDIEVKVVNFTETPEWMKTNIPMTDYPCTVFVKDNVIKYLFTGTKSTKNIKDIMKDIDF